MALRLQGYRLCFIFVSAVIIIYSAGFLGASLYKTHFPITVVTVNEQEMVVREACYFKRKLLQWNGNLTKYYTLNQCFLNEHYILG